MEIDLNALESAAMNATQGSWEVSRIDEKTGFWFESGHLWVGPAIIGTERSTIHEQDIADAVFIAAANPAVVLELTRRLRAAEEKLDFVADTLRTIHTGEAEDLMLQQSKAAEAATRSSTKHHAVVIRAFRETMKILKTRMTGGAA